ncbi:MAG: MBL fold metallo-hydrolase, partial [Bacteroidetes bacterium]|nr:MBL fold metallo-hydrolase [Bacteroidota bacterium]
LKFLEIGKSPFESVDFIHVDGHTEQMMLPLIRHRESTLLYAADLLPSTAHISLPWVMAYDVRPLLTMQEKESVLQRAVAENYVLLFEHDPVHEAVVVEMTEKGVRLRERGPLTGFL